MENRTLHEGKPANYKTIPETTRHEVSTLNEKRENPKTVREEQSILYDGKEGTKTFPGAWLPEILAKNYQIVEPFPASGGEADVYLVSDHRGIQSVAKIYRIGINPKESVLELLKQANPKHVIELKEYGYDDGRWWELLEYAKHSSLRALLKEEGLKLSISRAMEVIRELNDALEHIHSLNIEHRDLKPENILVRTIKPLDLVLTDFGTASIVNSSIRFSSLGRTLPYAPPEGMGIVVQDESTREKIVSSIVRTRWDYWSLGMIIVEIITGRHPFDSCNEATIAHRLSTQNMDVLTESVVDLSWRKLCRGLLRRDPKKRWGGGEVRRWLKNPEDADLRVQDEETSLVTSVTAFSFQGKQHYTPQTLAIAFSENWESAEDTWKKRNPDLRIWLEHNLGEKKLSDALKIIDQSKELNLDGQIFSAICLLNSEVCPNFRGVSLRKDSLEQLTTAALSGESVALDLIKRLKDGNILSIASGTHDGGELTGIATRWQENISEYERLYEIVITNGASVSKLENDNLLLAYLLASALPMEKVMIELRNVAERKITPDARECEWFLQLGTTQAASPAALLIIPNVIPVAETAARERRYTKNVETYGHASSFLSGFNKGALNGLFIASIPVVLIYWLGKEENAFTVGLLLIVISAVWEALKSPDDNNAFDKLVGNPERNPDIVRENGQRKTAFGILTLVGYAAIIFWAYLQLVPSVDEKLDTEPITNKKNPKPTTNKQNLEPVNNKQLNVDTRKNNKLAAFATPQTSVFKVKDGKELDIAFTLTAHRVSEGLKLTISKFSDRLNPKAISNKTYYYLLLSFRGVGSSGYDTSLRSHRAYSHSGDIIAYKDGHLFQPLKPIELIIPSREIAKSVKIDMFIEAGTRSGPLGTPADDDKKEYHKVSTVFTF
jgi:serine/threonine protein kinase